MSEQLYQLKSKGLEKDAPASNEGQLDFDHADKVEKDRMVELLKRNHDVMMEKYETYADRNKTLEKQTLEKEQLYISIKGENEALQHTLHQIRRDAENFRQENQILDSKFSTAESMCKKATEEAKSLKMTKE